MKKWEIHCTEYLQVARVFVVEAYDEDEAADIVLRKFEEGTDVDVTNIVCLGTNSFVQLELDYESD